MFVRVGFLLLGIIIFSQAAMGAAQAIFHASGVQDRPRETREDLQNRRDNLQNQLEQKRDEVRSDIKAKRNQLDAVKAERLKELQEARLKAKEVREEKVLQLGQKREEFRQKAQDRKVELRKKLGEIRGGRIDDFFSQMAQKFESAIDRLTSFADRIESRFDKAEVDGRDVVEVRVLLAEARQKIGEAQTELDNARANYSGATTEEDFKAAFARVRQTVSSVKTKVKEAHQALVEAIRKFKNVPPPAGSESGSGSGSE